MNKFEVRNMDLYYGSFHALKNINIDIPEKEITAFIGPSGCGKSTFLKSLNRMNDLVEGCRISGDIKLDGVDIYKDKMDVNVLRKRVGMVFQKPNPFPMSIYDNIAYGPRTHGIHNKAQLDEIVERSLRGAAIWDEVKDRLNKSALGMSGGQQQRLCIARALAVEPEVLLMDEKITPSSWSPTICSRPRVSAIRRHFSCWASWWRWARRSVCSPRPWTSAPRITSRAASAKEVRQMGTSVRKMYDAELLQLDTMLARMGHAAGKSTPPSMRSSTAA